MRSSKILWFFGIMLLIAGCVPSLHPLYTDKDLSFDPTLLGAWVGKDEKDTLTFQKSDENTYELIYSEVGKSAKFTAHFLQLGKFTFLDSYPQEPEIENDFYKFHLVPVHIFSKIWMEKDTLHMAMLDPDWLKEMIAQKKVKIKHEQLDNQIVLTASTQELQEFVLKYAEDAKAFSVQDVLHRQK